MARGRAPNLSLPPTRALTQQRDYRARKAARIAHLEDTNKELSDEIESLKRELMDVREGRGRNEEVEKIRQVRETLHKALSALDKIFPPASSNSQIATNGDERKPSTTPPKSASIGESSSSASRVIEEDRKEKRRREMDEDDTGDEYDDDDDEDCDQTPEVEGKEMIMLACGDGNTAKKGCCPPRTTKTPTEDTKRRRKTSSYSAISASPMAYPIGGYGMGPISHTFPSPPVGRTVEGYQYHPPQQTLPPLLSIPDPMREHQFPQHHQGWERPRPSSPTVSTTSSPMITPRVFHPWGTSGQGQLIYHYPTPPPLGHPVHPPSTAGSIASDRSSGSQMPSSSPDHPTMTFQEYRQQSSNMAIPAYDSSCCNGLFDCSSLPMTLRPIMHNVAISGGAATAAAAAALSYERGEPSGHQAQSGGGGRTAGMPVDNQRGLANALQSHPATPAPTGDVTTTVEWQAWNRQQYSGTWSTATSEGNPVDGTSVDSAFAAHSAHIVPSETTSVISGKSVNQVPASQETAVDCDVDEDKCCWGVMDCGAKPPVLSGGD